MTKDPGGPGRSLRTKVLAIGIGATLLVILGMSGLALLGLDVRDELERATDAFVEEQRTADRITRAVMGQMATASALSASSVEAMQPEFQVAGQEVHTHIRRYLFRDLSPEERLQLEEMVEEHQRMEVAAARTADLFTRGQVAAAEVAREAMFAHVLGLMDAMDAFLRMREAHLTEIREQQDATFRSIYLLGGGMSVLVLASFLVLVLVLNRRVTRPLEELAEASEKIAAGDLSVQVPRGRDQELRVLSDSFNRMAASLQRTTSDLERRHQELSHALSSLREAQDELVQSEKLSALGRMTAGLAHELNNPLSSVLGYGQLLAEQMQATDAAELPHLREEYLTPILSEASRAQHLVRNFLHFSRQSITDLEPVSLPEAVGSAVELRRRAFDEAGLELQVEALPRVHVRADPHLFQGVLVNIVNNARDAMSPAGRGRLTIQGRLEGDEVHLEFQDEGPGIQEVDRIFEPFYTSKPVGEGTGLGLALVHRFVTRFGGRVQAGNRAEGGARFRLVLPTLPPPIGGRTAEEGPDGNEDAELLSAGGESQPADVSDGSVPAAAAPASPRILVVEDKEPLRHLQQRLLERLGATVLLAESAGDARAILTREKVDAVVSDVRMPGEDGLAFYRWLQKARPELADRFLFVTGDVSREELIQMARKQPELFVHKPFHVDHYLERVSAILVGLSPSGVDTSPA